MNKHLNDLYNQLLKDFDEENDKIVKTIKLLEDLLGKDEILKASIENILVVLKGA